MKDNLPSFERPPVIEMVMGFQFKPIAGLTTGHLGAFWKELGEEWPNISEVTPIGIASVFVPPEPTWNLPFLYEPSATVRLRMTTATGDMMIQVENGWFVFNWIKKDSGREYPRFDYLKPSFDRYRAKFKSFLNSAGFQELEPTLWEVSYVNLAAQGALWKTPDDWRELFPGMMGNLRPSFSEGLMKGDAHWVYSLNGGTAQMLIDLQPGRISGTNRSDAVVLRLTTRGLIEHGDSDGVDAGISLGRESIVRAFAEVAGEKARSYWGFQG